MIFFNRAETSTAFHFSLLTPEFRGQKVVAIRDVIEHKDVQVPTSSNFMTKTIRKHSVANYIFTLGSKEENVLTVE